MKPINLYIIINYLKSTLFPQNFSEKYFIHLQKIISLIKHKKSIHYLKKLYWKEGNKFYWVGLTINSIFILGYLYNFFPFSIVISIYYTNELSTVIYIDVDQEKRNKKNILILLEHIWYINKIISNFEFYTYFM